MGLSRSTQQTNNTSSGTTAGTSTGAYNNASTGAYNNASTYGYMTPPSTPALDALRNRTFEIDPGLAAQYGRQRREFTGSYNNPTGSFVPQGVREAQTRSGLERLGRDEAQAMREGQYDVNRLNYARDVSVAGMAAPQLVQTGSSGTQSGTQTGAQTGTQTGNYTGNQQGTTVQNQSPWGTLGGIAASAAPISL